MKKTKLIVLFSAFMLILPISFASANELTIVEAPTTGTSSMSGVYGGQEMYYTASFKKSSTAAKYSKFSYAKAKKLHYAKILKQKRVAHHSK